MGQSYHTIEKKDSGKLAAYLVQHGQMLLPMVELIEQSQMAVDELIDVLGRASIEAVLRLSAQSVAGVAHQGRAGGEIGWHGTEQGSVKLSDRKLRVRRPRLRRRVGGKGAEVAVPAYEAMQCDGALARRLVDILMRGVSQRNYAHVLPEMAETVGVSKSAVSREFVQASAEELRALCERRFDEVDLLVIYIDGLRFAGHHVVAAVGVDGAGYKHVLGIREGATENEVVVTGLLEDLVSRGVSPKRRRLFVIDGSKALRAGIDPVFGTSNPVQRCRNHKVRNVLGHLPEEHRKEMELVMKAAYRLDAQEGIERLRTKAKWLEKDYPSAAASLLEGLEETFTVSRLGLSSALRRCLCTTNIIENPQRGVRMRTRRVTRWRDGQMVMRWAATAFLHAEKSFRRIMGYEDLWMLRAALGDNVIDNRKEAA